MTDGDLHKLRRSFLAGVVLLLVSLLAQVYIFDLMTEPIPEPPFPPTLAAAPYVAVGPEPWAVWLKGNEYGVYAYKADPGTVIFRNNRVEP